ncbi:MAG: hypothetical protein KF745_14530 [Phycisphaeraceae bacterium]|nr:hypothetical protein [Phycisphaeraceae bacterium]
MRRLSVAVGVAGEGGEGRIRRVGTANDDVHGGQWMEARMRARSITVCIAAAALAGAAARAGAGVIYVRAGASGAGNGASWADAFTGVQAALDAAQAGDQIWVAAGVYRPGVSGGSRESSFLMKTGVALYGGFAGTEGSLGQRDWRVNVTTLSGDLNGDDGPEFSNRADNAYHVVVALNVADTAVIDGFVVRGGHADGPGFGALPTSKNQGSGINVYDAQPRIVNCTLVDNYASDHGTINDHGDSTVIDCVFDSNYAGDHGAGLYSHNHAMTMAMGCTFRNNVTPGKGGGSYTQSGHAQWIDCVFTGNVAERGAGFYHHTGSATAVTGCTFTGNTGTVGGGGVYCDVADATITGCTFTQNVAGLGVEGGSAGAGGSGGAGVWCSGGAPRVLGCTFTNNAASFGAGVYNNDFTVAVISDCVFNSNHANEGAGVYTLFSDVTVTNCTFTSNTASQGAFPVGGGVSSYFANSTFTGCTFVGNTAELGGGAVYVEGESPRVTSCTMRANAAIGGNDCCGSDGWGGALMVAYFTTPVISNCVMTSNTADLGGAVFNLAFGDPLIVNCTMIGNSARVAGAVYGFGNSEGTIVSSVISDNTPHPQIDGEVVAPVRYSLVRGVAASAGAGVVNADPMLVRLPGPGPDGVWFTVDDDGGDPRPRSGSPCIDAGDTGAVPAFLTGDAAGLARVRNDAGMPDAGVPGMGGVVDLGAFEFQGTSCRADVDGNGVVEPVDIAAFIQKWIAGVTGGNQNGDFDRSGVTEPVDLAAFVQAWISGVGAGCP